MLVRSKIKPFFIFFAVVSLLVGVTYFWSWKSKLSRLEAEAREKLVKAEKFEVLVGRLNQEKNRCLEFLAQKEGEFAEFSYCQKLVEFFKNLELN